MKKNIWANASAQKCKAVYDLLCKLYHLMGNLPEDRSPSNLVGGITGDELLGFAQRVFEDENLWAKVPDKITSSQNLECSKGEFRESLQKLLDESRTKPAP